MEMLPGGGISSRKSKGLKGREWGRLQCGLGQGKGGAWGSWHGAGAWTEGQSCGELRGGEGTGESELRGRTELWGFRQERCKVSAAAF